MQSTVLKFIRYGTGLIRTKISSYLLLFVVLFGLSEKCSSQKPDYEIIFGKEWQKALIFLDENKSWIEPVLTRSDVSYALAMAIIFPELVRYSALRDKMEVSMLKILYINLGEDYADFSIGPFQMKPSFAELVRQESNILKERKIRNFFKAESSYKDEKDYRSEIVGGLQDPKQQLNYLINFIKICEKKFAGSWTDERSETEYLSTVYNSGLNLTREEIEHMKHHSYFNIRLIAGDFYTYSDVSLYWYDNFSISLK